MAGNYWIKFYVEVLDDPKMATLPDRLWRRFYELCLLAGKYYDDGNLPDCEQLARALRMSVDELQSDLDALVNKRLITKTEDGYLVTQFVKRQSKMSNAEKTARYRKSKHTEEYESNYPVTEPVTDVLLKVTQITDNRLTDNRLTDNRLTDNRLTDNRLTDNRLQITEAEAEKNAAGAVFRAYESEIGLLTPAIADKINLAIEDYPLDWITDGIKESAKHNARSWAYVEAILKRWKFEGKSNGKRPAKITSDDNERIAREVMDEYLATQRR